MASVTANDIVIAVLRRLNLISEVETPSAEQASNGLTALNEMMHGFSRRGIAYAHTDLGGTDTVNMPDDLIGDLKWLMAERLADDGYEVTLKPQQMKAIHAARRALQAAYYLQRNAPVDTAIRPRGYGGYNFTTDR